METLTQSTLRLAPLQPHHYPQVRSIYEQGLATGNASFETQSSDWEKWDSSHLPYGRTVALFSDQVAGWVALTPVSERCVYQGVAEVSVYVHPAFQGQGVGRQLLTQLIQESEAQGLWTLQAGIFPENTGSLALHEKAGFRVVGRREKIGQREGVWRDVLLLERRSPMTGQ